MQPELKAITRWLVIWAIVAMPIAGCAPRPTISAPQLPQAAPPPLRGDRQAYRVAEDIATARSAKAPDAFRSFIARFPSSPLVPRALMRLGELHLERGEIEAARDAYRRLLSDYSQNPLAPRVAVKLLATYYQEGDFENLLARSETLDQIPLNDAQRQRVWRMRIDAFLALGRNAEAAKTAVTAWQAATEAERQGLAEKIALAIGALSPQEVAELMSLPMTPEAQRLIDGLVGEFAYDRYTLGCMLPLSGPYAIYGQRALQGIEMALSRFATRSAAPPIRLVIEDTRSQSDRAASIVQALANRRVAAIVGPMATAAAAAAEAQAQRIPIVTFTQREQIPAIGDYVFRHFITAQSQAEALVRWAAERRAITRFAALYPADKYGQAFLPCFTDAVAAHGGRMVGIEAYDPQGTDFAQPIGKLAGPAPRRAMAFEALFIPDGPAKAGLILPQLAFHDVVDVVLMGTNLWQSRTLVEMAGSFVEGAVFPTGFFEDDPDPAVARFISDFRNNYDQDPGFVEAVAYDTAMMLFDIFSRPTIRSRAQIRDALTDGAPYTGLTGETIFDADGEVHKSLSIIIIQEGRFTLLDRVPATFETSRPTLRTP